MADIARMRFQSAKNPEESGFLSLDSDGTIRVEPSDAMLEAIASLEQKAVETSSRTSQIAAITLIGLGALAAFAGWYGGRTGGRLRERLTNPRDVRDTDITYDAQYGLHVRFSDGLLRPTTTLGWAPGEYNSDEAENFYERFRDLSGMPTAEQE